MTPAIDLIGHLSRKGVTICQNGDKLVLDGPADVLTDDVIEQVRTQKPSIIHSLHQSHPTDPDCAFQERAAITEYEGDLPREWAEGLAVLCTTHNPLNTPDPTWQTLVNNAAEFAEKWGRNAVDLGWSVRDVFGCNPRRPLERVDQAGLIFLIGDGDVIAITENTAVIEMPTGNRLTYYRRGQAGQTPIWGLESNDNLNTVGGKNNGHGSN